jgi:hypothetical protein
VCRLLNGAKVETNTSFNQSLLTLFDLIICIHMLLVNIGDRRLTNDKQRLQDFGKKEMHS